MVLAGRGVIITGGSRGLGAAIAEACLREGANVLICGRDAQALDETRQRLQSLGPIHVLAVDIAEPGAADRLIAHGHDNLPSLDCLVNNAGVYGPKGTLDQVSMADWTRTIQVNLVGAVASCQAVLPYMRAERRGRIVNISGGGATRPLPQLSAYAASKAALVRFTETLAHELGGTGITVNAVAPGPLNTRLLDEIIEAGPDAVGVAVYERSLRQLAEGGMAVSISADLCVYLMSDTAADISGRLISAQWDQWRTLHYRSDELAQQDLYTLRRVAPNREAIN